MIIRVNRFRKRGKDGASKRKWKGRGTEVKRSKEKKNRVIKK